MPMSEYLDRFYSGGGYIDNGQGRRRLAGVPTSPFQQNTAIPGAQPSPIQGVQQAIPGQILGMPMANPALGMPVTPPATTVGMQPELAQVAPPDATTVPPPVTAPIDPTQYQTRRQLRRAYGGRKDW